MIRFTNNHTTPKKTSPLLVPRLLLIAGGCACLLGGVLSLQRGVWVYANSFGQTVFAGGAIGTGTILVLCAFLPSTSWIHRLITTRHEARKPSQLGKRPSD